MKPPTLYKHRVTGIVHLPQNSGPYVLFFLHSGIFGDLSTTLISGTIKMVPRVK